jgi:hypothetical protein
MSTGTNHAPTPSNSGPGDKHLYVRGAYLTDFKYRCSVRRAVWLGVGRAPLGPPPLPPPQQVWLININVPVVSMALYVMVLRGATSLPGALEGVGPENQDFFAP